MKKKIYRVVSVGELSGRSHHMQGLCYVSTSIDLFNKKEFPCLAKGLVRIQLAIEQHVTVLRAT